MQTDAKTKNMKRCFAYTIALWHLEMLCEDKGERIAVKEIRKFVGWYTKGMRGAPAVRREINQVSDAQTMTEIISRLL